MDSISLGAISAAFDKIFKDITLVCHLDNGERPAFFPKMKFSTNTGIISGAVKLNKVKTHFSESCLISSLFLSPVNCSNSPAKLNRLYLSSGFFTINCVIILIPISLFSLFLSVK